MKRAIGAFSVLGILLLVWWYGRTNSTPNTYRQEQPYFKNKGAFKHPWSKKERKSNNTSMAKKKKEKKSREFKPRHPASIVPVETFIFHQGNGHYRAMPEVKAVKKEDLPTQGSYQLLEVKFGRALIRSDTPVPTSGWVVQNQKTKILGVVTGILKVKMTDFEERQGVADQYGIREHYSFPGIRLALFQSDDRDLESLRGTLEEIKKDPRVQSASLEILELPQGPQ